jgi:hypothetical protein
MIQLKDYALIAKPSQNKNLTARINNSVSILLVESECKINMEK